MGRIHSGILIHYKGQKVKAEAYEFSRQGSLSPTSLYFKYQNRWISPLEQKTKGHWLVDSTITGLFKLYYGCPEKWQEQVKANPFLALIKKENSFGAYVPIPVLYGS